MKGVGIHSKLSLMDYLVFELKESEILDFALYLEKTEPATKIEFQPL